jgi:hypothetical protein
MHPAIIQAVAAERTRDLHARAAAQQRVAIIRRFRRAQRPQPVVRAGRGSWILRSPRAA